MLYEVITSGNPAVSLTISDKDEFYSVTKEISESEDQLIVIWLDYESTASYEDEAVITSYSIHYTKLYDNHIL